MRCKFSRVALAVFFIMLIVSAIPSLVQAQSTDTSFQQAVTEYQHSPNTVTAQKVIKSTLAMAKLPSIPEEARKHFMRGAALFKEAKTPDDFSQVIDEFRQATRLAPWWQEARYNWASAYEAAGNYTSAISNFKLYQLFKLNDTEARAVQDKIYILEAKQEKAEKEKEKAEVEKQNKKALKNLEGLWKRKFPEYPARTDKYTVTVQGNNIKIYWSYYFDQNTANFDGKHWFEGTINGHQIAGTYSIDRTWWENGRVFSYPFTGSISDDGNIITLKHTTINITGADSKGAATGWREYLDEFQLER